MASNSLLEQAKERGKRLQRAFPTAVAARYDRASGNVIIRLSSRLNLSFSPRDAQGLEHAKPSDLERIEITPSGFGLHFPKLDADLYVPSLLEGFLGSKKWMAAQLGRSGGQATSKAKKAASRANGKLGGRPGKRAATGG
jgi:Protein of unknown function (DUF2442)